MGVDYIRSAHGLLQLQHQSDGRCGDAVLSYAVLFALLNGARIRTEPLPSHWLGYG